MHRFWMMIPALIISCAAAGGEPETAIQSTLTLVGARQVIAAAHEAARHLGAPGGSIAVVDAGGHLIALERLDNTFAASPDIATGKARTAALFRKPTRVFEELVNGGRTTMVTLPGFTPLQGGVPLTAGGQVVGAVGVSGAASAQQDEDIANAAVAGFSAAAGESTD